MLMNGFIFGATHGVSHIDDEFKEIIAQWTVALFVMVTVYSVNVF